MTRPPDSQWEGAAGTGSETGRAAVLEEKLAGLARRFIWRFEPCEGSSHLCIIFSSTAKRFAFSGRRWPFNVLFVADTEDAYYVIGAGRAADLLCESIDEGAFENVLFMGSSKAGFGAVLWATLCAKRRPQRIFRALAFSAQTRLYPFNEELVFPSYRKMWIRARGDERVMAALRAYGDLGMGRNVGNALVTYVYGERNVIDRKEAGRLFAPQIRKYPVPLRFHGSIIPFTVRQLEEPELRQWISRLYAKADADADLRSILPGDPEVLVREFDAMQWIPDLDTLVLENLMFPARPARGLRSATP